MNKTPADQTSPSLEAENELLEALKIRDGRATLGDLVRDTGLPKNLVEQQVRQMLGLYQSHLDVDDNGELLYRFQPSMARRVKAKDGLTRFFAWSKRAMVFSIKLATMVILITYTVMFCVLIVLVMIGLSFLGDGPDFDFIDGDAGIVWWSFDLLRFWSVGEITYIPVAVSERGPSSDKTLAGAPASLRAPGELEAQLLVHTYTLKRSGAHHFYDDIFSFIFGPQLPEPPRLALERNILAFINNNHGILTLSELVSRTGLSVEAAQEELGRLLGRYEGDIEVTKGGELLYTFHDLRVTAGNEGRDTPSAPPAWHRFEGDQRLTGNSTRTNVFIGAMIVCTIIMSILSPALLFPNLSLRSVSTIPLVILPFVVGLLYFIIPAFRSVDVRHENILRRRRNIRRAALLSIFRHIASTSEGSLGLNALHGQSRSILETLKDNPDDAVRLKVSFRKDSAELKKEIGSMLDELSAEFDVDEAGLTTIRFPRQRAELLAADEARVIAAQHDTSLTEIVYATDDDDDDPLNDAFKDLARQDDAKLKAKIKEEAVADIEAAAEVTSYKNH